MYNVIIVDDQPSSRDIMKYAILLGGDRYYLAKEFADADMVMSELHFTKPDLILLDIFTGGKENGIAVARQIKEKHPNVKIIILTFLIQKRHIEEAKRIGCEGFWYKDHPDTTLLQVMDNVMNGHIHYPESQPIVTIGMAKISDFTKKELQILQAKIDGLTAEEICEMLSIKLPTLKTHMCNIRNKTGYSNFIKLTADIVAKRFIITDDTVV